MSADGGQSVTKGGFILDVPTGLAYRQISWVKQLGHDCHQAEDAKETRRGSFDGAVRPLALGFEAEESTQFFKRDFDVPTQSETDDDLPSRNVCIGAEESGGIEAVFWTAHQHPTDSNWVLAWCMPKGDTGDEFDEMFLTIKNELEFLPVGFRVFQVLRELGLACAFLRFWSAFTLWLWHRETEQTGIQAQTRDQLDRFLEPLAAFHQRNGSITTIANQRDLSIWLPAPYFVNHELSPLHNGAVAFIELGTGFLS